MMHSETVTYHSVYESPGPHITDHLTLQDSCTFSFAKLQLGKSALNDLARFLTSSNDLN